MKDQYYITSFCRLTLGKVDVNGAIGFEEPTSASAEEFLRSVYKHYQLSYPKFYKMDKLCKLAFLASELLLKNNPVSEQYKSEDIAIIMSNNSSSLEVDTEHQQSISDPNNYFPSPSVFVYTLPNILIGEIAIRNKIKGENTFFIFDKFDALSMSNYVDLMLNTKKAECCLVGWVELYENSYDAFIYTVEKKEGNIKIPHTKENLINLYK